MSRHAEHLARVARGWDGAVDGYDAYFVPRFAPWLRAAVTTVTEAAVPAGPILVPCCGTFPELDLLRTQFPDREIVGVDLSAGMVARARERAAGAPLVRVVEGDASTVESGRYAAVVSVFGLQQLPSPDVGIGSWTGGLVPGGLLSVVYWPGVTEEAGPFALMSEVLRSRVLASDSSWEERLSGAVTDTGAVLERDTLLEYPMIHANAETMVDAYVHSGPLRALADARGEEFMAEVRAEFLGRAPAGEWTHRPRARLLVARR